MLTTTSQIICQNPSTNSWIVYVRNLLAVYLVDKIRQKLILKMNARRRVGTKWRGKLIPYADR